LTFAGEKSHGKKPGSQSAKGLFVFLERLIEMSDAFAELIQHFRRWV